MFGNYLAAAIRNLARNRLHAAITTLSLALGFAALILAAMFARYETTYDRFWPHWDRTYIAIHLTHVPGRPPFVRDTAPGVLASSIQGDIPGVEAAARMTREAMRVANGQAEAQERSLFWIDHNLFDLLAPKVIAGDISNLAPGSVVLPRTQARKYFGSGAAVGGTLTLTREGKGDAPGEVILAAVAAVIEDLPPNTHVPAEIFLTVRDPAQLSAPDAYAATYFRVRPGVGEAAVNQAFVTLSKRRLPPDMKAPLGRVGRPEVKARPLKYVYMRPVGDISEEQWTMSELGTGNSAAVLLLWALAALLLGVAAINFVTLMTARGARRAVEVGVRKAAGARRLDLVVQFIGEALVHAVLALAIALAMVELVMPVVRKALELPLKVDYLGDPRFSLAVLFGAVGIGLIAGLYPSFALSAFRPAQALKGGLAKTPGSAALRQVLIALQFTPLLILALGAVTIEGQLRRAERNSLKMMPEHTLMVREACTPALKSAVATLPDVRQAACLEMDSSVNSARASLETIGVISQASVKPPSNSQDRFWRAAITDAEGLEFWNLRPIAGRLWSPAEDDPGIVINATTARAMGLVDPKSAVGRILDFRREEKAPLEARRVIGVIPDRGGLAGLETAVYYQDLNAKRRPRLGIRLTGENTQATVAAIDRVLVAQGVAAPIDRNFYRDIVAENFVGLRQATQLMAAFVALCVLIAVFGLFGLSSFLAEQRTKEIGVRKALGASRSRLMRMLLFQFAKPVLIANIVACPLVYVASELLQRGEAPDDRIVFGLMQLLPVILGSMALAFAATFAHAWQVTGARPVTAPRYE